MDPYMSQPYMYEHFGIWDPSRQINKMCELEGEGHLLPFYINILVIKLYIKLVIIHNGVLCFDNLLKFDLWLKVKFKYQMKVFNSALYLSQC